MCISNYIRVNNVLYDDNDDLPPCQNRTKITHACTKLLSASGFLNLNLMRKQKMHYFAPCGTVLKNVWNTKGILFLIIFQRNFYEICPYHAMQPRLVCKSRHRFRIRAHCCGQLSGN